MSSSAGSNKPSWAFDVADGVPRSNATLQSYRIPYPRSPESKEEAREPYVWSRFFLIIVNLIFFVIGISMVVAAIVAAAKPESCQLCYSILRPLLISGILCTFISAIGLFGSATNSYKLLLVFVTCVAFLLMVQMIVFFWSLFGRNNFKERLHGFFTDKFRHHPNDLIPLLDRIQAEHACCGVNGPLDYHSGGIRLPLSCCRSSPDFHCPDSEGGGSTAFIPTAPPANASTANGTVAINATTASPPTNSTEEAALPAMHTKMRAKRNVSEPPPVNGTAENGTAVSAVHDLVLPSTLAPLSNLSNWTGENDLPQHWQDRHVQLRGCYSVMWAVVDGRRSVLIGATVGLMLFLTLQLLVLCMAHRVARGGFIYDGYVYDS